MVSGLVTSPCDQLRIFSGDARLMRMASKSATGFAISNGLERNMFLRFPTAVRRRTRLSRTVASRWSFVASEISDPEAQEQRPRVYSLKRSRTASRERPTTSDRRLICRHGHRLLLRDLDQLDIQAKRLQFANQHVERLGDTRLHRGLAFDDGLVDFGASVHIVRLRGQQLLQDERGAVCFECPDFHCSEALASELRFATQRLLRDQRVRPDGTRVNLVVHQVRQLQHVDVAHRDRQFELLARHAVSESGLAGCRKARTSQQRLDFRLPGAVEHGRSHEHALLKRRSHRFELIFTHVGDGVGQYGVLDQSFEIAADSLCTSVLLQQFRDLQTQFMTRPSEVGFKNLSHVHTAGHAERVQNDLDRRSILEVRHVLFRQDARDHALVPVPSGHLVADAQLALHGDVHLDQLDNARRQFIALGQLLFLFVDDLLEHIDLARGHLLDLVDLLVHPRILVGILDTLQVAGGDAFDLVAIEDVALRQKPLVGALVVQIGLHFLAPQQAFQTLQALIDQNSDLVRKVLFELRDLVAFNRLGALVLLLALAREYLHIHHDAFDSGWAVERSVAHVAGFFAKDRAQQLLFRRQLSLALRRNLADDDVALLDSGADADHTRFVQIS